MKSRRTRADSQNPKRLYRLLYPGINTRIIGPFLIVIAFVAAIGVFIMTRLVAGSLQERFNNQLLDSAAAANSSIADIEREQLATLRLMVFTDGVPEAIAEHNTADLDLWLRPIAANAQVDDLIIFDANGHGILQLTRASAYSTEYLVLTPPDMSQWNGVRRVLDQNPDAQGDKFVDIVGTAPNTLFYVTALAVDGDGTPVGGISLGMRVTRMAELISAQALSAVALYDQRGTVLGSTFRLVPTSELTLTRARSRELIASTHDASPVEARTLNGTPYQVLYTPFYLRSQQIGLLSVGLPTNFIVDRISTSRDMFGVMFSVMFLVIGLIGLITSRSITKPIGQMVDTTRAIREGDLTKRVGLSTPDEIGELASSFDHMTAQLIERNEEIEELYYLQIRETAQRDAVLASIGDAVIMQTVDGTILLRNQAAVALLKSLEGDAEGYADFDRARYSPETGKQGHTVELAGRFFSVVAMQIRLSSGTVMGHVIVFRDITALLEAEHMKDAMIQQMSHDLRTPLTVIHSSIDLVRALEASNLTHQGRDFIQKAMDSLYVLERMVDQVVDVSAITSNHFSISPEYLNLSDLLRQRVQNWQRQTDDCQLDLCLELPSQDIWIEADIHYLAQVIDHLLRNACSYTLPGGEINVMAVSAERIIKIYVMDNGVGIPAEELEHVFERLYRGSATDAGVTNTRGLGLGLYLSQCIVEAHRGTITIDSKVDYGTVVQIELPIRQGAAK